MSRVAEILLAQGRSAGDAARAKREIWGGTLASLSQLPLQIQHQRRLDAREQRQAEHDTAMLALERARAARAQGDYARADAEFARSQKLHELQSQVTQAAFSEGTWNSDAAMQAAASVGNVAPDLAPDVLGWAQEQSAKFQPKQPPRAAAGSFALDEKGMPIPGSEVPSKPPAPSAASLATAAAAGDEKAKAALDLLQNREHSTSNVDLALRAVNGDTKAEAALKLLKEPTDRKLTPNVGLESTLKLRDRFVRETQAANTVTQQLALMKSSLKAAEAGNMAAGSQGVLVTFQKILDPTSVVRESEYARSASGQALLSRIEGAADKLVKGGAGVPVSELKQFVSLAEQFARDQAASAGETKRQIDAIAGEYGLKSENITRDIGRAAATDLDAAWAKLPKPQPTAPAGAMTPEQSQFLVAHPEYAGQWPAQPNERPAPKKNPFR
jgi:hypothetical protein